MKTTTLETMPKFVIDKIAELTDINEHTMALSCLSMELNSGKAFVRLASINCEHMDHGHLAAELYNERNEIRAALYTEAKNKYANFNEIVAAF